MSDFGWEGCLVVEKMVGLGCFLPRPTTFQALPTPPHPTPPHKKKKKKKKEREREREKMREERQLD